MGVRTQRWGFSARVELPTGATPKAHKSHAYRKDGKDMEKIISKTDEIMMSVKGSVKAMLAQDKNTRTDDGYCHNTDKTAMHTYTATEFLMNNTVRRLVQAQGYKDGYKLVQTCKASEKDAQIVRVKLFIAVCNEPLPKEVRELPLVLFVENRLQAFALKVDGVRLEREPVPQHYWNRNPAMRVKG